LYTPARLELITAVGPPLCPTITFLAIDNTPSYPARKSREISEMRFAREALHGKRIRVECTPLLHCGAHKDRDVPGLSRNSSRNCFPEGFKEQVAQKILTNMGKLYPMPGFLLTLLYLFLVLYARPNWLHRENFYAILGQRTMAGEKACDMPAENCVKQPRWDH
jgi:hypothetical protein